MCVCTTIENFFLEKGEIATLNGQTIASNLGDVGGCVVAAGLCTNGDGTIIWMPQVFSKICAYTVLGRYPAIKKGEAHNH